MFSSKWYSNRFPPYQLKLQSLCGTGLCSPEMESEWGQNLGLASMFFPCAAGLQTFTAAKRINLQLWSQSLLPPTSVKRSFTSEKCQYRSHLKWCIQSDFILSATSFIGHIKNVIDTMSLFSYTEVSTGMSAGINFVILSQKV